MEIHDLIEAFVRESGNGDTFTAAALIRHARASKTTGIAVATGPKKRWCLAFRQGEAEGAVYSDEDGDLFGDKAVLRITGGEQFVLHTGNPDLVEAVVMGSRIYERSRLPRESAGMMPEIGTKSSGIGHLSIQVRNGAEVQNGIRVMLRKDGRVVGSDVTTGDGRAGFRVMFGEYDCIVQDRNQQIRSYRVRFQENDQKITVDLGS